MQNQSQHKQTKDVPIPKGWQSVQLDQTIEDIQNGFASGARDKNGIVQIRMNNVTTDGKIIFDSVLKVPIPERVEEWLLKAGDFLFNNTNSYDLVGKSGIFKETPFPCTFSNHFTRIRFQEDKVVPEYVLYHFVRLWRKGYFKSVAIRHVGQSAVNKNYLLKLNLPLPPRPEQRKIAEILGTADESIEQVHRAIEKAERLKQGLMQELLTTGIAHKKFKETEIGPIPNDWDLVRIENICDLGRGRVISQKEINKNRGTYPVYSSQSKGKGEFGFLNTYDFDGEYVTWTTDGAYAGSVFYRKGKFNCTNVCGTLKAKIDTVDMIYLSLILGTKTKRYVSFVGNNKLMNNVMADIPVPLPPLPEQRKIAEILQANDTYVGKLREKKGKLEQIKKGVMDDLLTGKRRVRV